VKRFSFKRASILTLVALSLSVGFSSRMARAASTKEVPAGMHTVPINHGDTLSKIALTACEHPLSWLKLGALNDITEAPYTIYAGKSLVVPCPAQNSVAQSVSPAKATPEAPTPSVDSYQSSVSPTSNTEMETDDAQSFPSMLWSKIKNHILLEMIMTVLVVLSLIVLLILKKEKQYYQNNSTEKYLLDCDLQSNEDSVKNLLVLSESPKTLELAAPKEIAPVAVSEVALKSESLADELPQELFRFLRNSPPDLKPIKNNRSWLLQF
jgi:hypothetical protein